MREIIVVSSLTLFEMHEWLFARDLFAAFVGYSRD